jgi:KDO2-lipid IV(A) lauroyltransferase
VRRGFIDTTALRANLRAVSVVHDEAELDALVLANVRSYGRYWVELFELASGRRSLILERVVVHGEQRLRNCLVQGRGVIIALPHMANWDLAGAWLAQHQDVVTVAERISPPRLFRIFMNLRTSLGMTVVPLDSGSTALTRLRTALEAGAAVCLVADRVVAGSAGVQVQFAGGAATLPAGPALLAYQTGAALIPVRLWYAGAAMHVQFCEPVTVDSTMTRRDAVYQATQHLADEFAAFVSTHPADWRALQPVWEEVIADA